MVTMYKNALLTLNAIFLNGVRSFIITFDVYVILDIFEKYDNKRPDPICSCALGRQMVRVIWALVKSNRKYENRAQVFYSYI